MLRPFGLDGKPTRLKVAQETSNDLMMKILETHFTNIADAHAFWLRREAHMPKSGSRDSQRFDGEG